jgi:glyoxylase-like metal-dependent hydrolase (beta-lactamase superfamily II)
VTPPSAAEVAIVVGEPVSLSQRVRRLTCGNPGVMTGPGTNTYLIGHEEIVVIDPGPDDEAHLEKIAAAGGDRIRWIVVTHTHPDHSPGAQRLRQLLPKRPPNDPVLVLGYEGGRDGFEPDAEIGEGHTIEADEFTLRALHTPGHASNHLCYLLEEERLLFSGDHIMNGSTVVISPPDGDMTAYLSSLERLRSLGLKAIAPAHGRVIDDPIAKIDEYVTHRLAREDAVAAALAQAQRSTVAELVPIVYQDVDESRFPIAQFSLWAHLRKLEQDGRALTADRDDVNAVWEFVAAG